MVLSSDLAGVCKRTDNNTFEAAFKAFPKSKVLQGRYIAQNIQKVPDELESIIREVPRLHDYGKINSGHEITRGGFK